jgi:ABC-type glycerol-3-phosphate transport system permease component
MPIISRIGRRSTRTRLLIATIYAVLSIGAVTMIYPFTLMIAGSTKSAVDISENRLVPSYLTSDTALWRKHVEALFNESLSLVQECFYRTDVPAFNKLDLPKSPNPKLAAEWLAFLEATQPPYYTYTLCYLFAPNSKGVAPTMRRALKKELSDRFDDDVEKLNQGLEAEFIDWQSVFVRPDQYLLRRDKPDLSPMGLMFREFKSRQPIIDRFYYSPEGFYRRYLRSQYPRDIRAYNRAHGTRYRSYAQLHLTRQLPGKGYSDSERKDWLEFARTLLSLFWIRADDSATADYRAFLKAKYGDIQTLNRAYKKSRTSFGDVPLIEEPPDSGLALSDWNAFLQGWKDPDSGVMHQLPADKIRIHSIDFMFRDHLLGKYGSPDEANAALGTAYANWLDVVPPQEDAQYFAFKGKTGAIRREFSTRNYITVIDTMVLHGRGVINTVIYCVLAVLASLIVNPLAAYALSRYKPPSAYKVLLFLMLTMAFPPMVTQIPVFLMLREFNLLNTFWALILPGLANGYSIFLLKGFFDSLPQELYESASLDGAGEMRIFWQITMSLSKPILAVIGLNAFNLAYSNFMFALLICQDKSMWTLMVWIYQLRQGSGPGVVFAALIIGAIPTFLMFAFCQNIIMRGIVVPVEK